MSCEVTQAFFTKGNGNNQVYIGTEWARTMSVTIDGQSRVYDDITLAGTIYAQDEDGNPLEISLTEQVDTSTTGIYKVPAVSPAVDITEWTLTLIVADTSLVKPGIYSFVVYGTPLDGKKYVEINGCMEFSDPADCS